jgi:hypothetical protein
MAMKTNNKKRILIIALVALVSCMIAPVSAETLTGTLGGGNYSQLSYSNGGFMGGTNPYQQLTVNDVEMNGNLLSFIIFDNYQVTSYDAGAPAGATTSFILRHGNIATGDIIATGTMGYQRLWNTASPPVEQLGYVWLTFDNGWNLTAAGTGDHNDIYINYSRSALYNATRQGTGTTRIPPNPGNIELDGNPAASYLETYLVTTNTFYSATKPGGIGISGYATKSSGTSSKVFILNGSSPFETITSEYTQTITPFNFSVYAESIIVSAQDSKGNFYNSSVLFSPTVPTTPTVTPTPTTTIPVGYVRNNLYIWDTSDAQISGADINILDVEAGTWTNYTADADGWVTIDTPPYHTVNVYAHYPTANIYLPNEILGLETGYYGGHNWVLVLFPYTTTTPGSVMLYINARNYDTKAVLTGVGIQIEDLTTHYTTQYNTGTSDNIWSIVTNATNYKITGSKSGYISKSTVINSGEDPSMTVVIELSRATVTPTITGTVLPGETTVRPTVDSRTVNEKDADMMGQIRDAGPNLIDLAILATIFGLVGLIGKSMR